MIIKNKLQYLKKKLENEKNDDFFNQIQHHISNQQEIKIKSTFDDDISQESEESLNYVNEESKEILSPTSPEQRISSKSKTKITGSTSIKEKDIKSTRTDDFEPSFLSKLNIKIKQLFPNETGIMNFNKDFNLYNFEIDKPKKYIKYYQMENIDNNLKKFQVFLRTRERKMKKNKKIAIMKMGKMSNNKESTY